MVRRNPSPQGFVATAYGQPWVSHSPRVIQVKGWFSQAIGNQRIFDPTQRINLAEMVIPGGIFGDVSIINKNKWLKLAGFDSAEFSRWAIVASNKRAATLQGFDALALGQPSISNVSATLAPQGIKSLAMGAVFVGERVRSLRQYGHHSLVFGRPVLNQTPSLKPNGMDSNAFGTAFISVLHRHIEPQNNHVLKMGEPTVWFANRAVKVQGFASALFAKPVLSHELRHVQANGSRFDAYGMPWVSFAKRYVLPESIYKDFASNHKVGGTQHIQVAGFDATLFGTRIIPERHSIYPQGFSNTMGEPSLELKTQCIQPKGFITVGLEPQDRWGKAKAWNKTQYIVQDFDPNNGLVPPAWPKWMQIENRNKKVLVSGFNTQKFGYQQIANNARVIQPKGFDAFASGVEMISHWLRHIQPDGLQHPYFSGWSAVHNAARVIAPFSIKPMSMGQPESVLNNRRIYRRVGNFDSLQMGQPMIADRERKLNIESRYSIHPPVIPLPVVKLHTRYIDEYEGFDSMRVGMPALSIHWNKIVTRWTLQNLYGFPTVRNVTPEHRVFGHDSAEYGVPSIRTQWRNVVAAGENSNVFGKPTIKDRKQKILVGGFSPSVVSDKLKVTKGVSPPYTMQLIEVNAGIEAPAGQVGKPSFNHNVVHVDGFHSLKFGDAAVRSNGILIEAGIFEDQYGEPHVSLKNRVLQVQGIANPIVLGKPGLSPHTLYAVIDAPEQARQNHPSGNLHYVNSDGGKRPPGEVFGQATVRLKLDHVRHAALDQQLAFGQPIVQLKRVYVSPKGIQAYRFGWHNVGDGRQFLKQFAASDFMLMGSPAVQHKPVVGVLGLKPEGLNALSFGQNHIELLHREIKPGGFDSMQMGTKLPGDQPYMWQGLRVGELMPTIPQGFNAEVFGRTWVSLKVRQVQPEGFDSFISEYDLNQFAKRMKVMHLQQSTVPEAQYIQTVGFDLNCVATPNIKPKTQYIRPTGNTDQFRKGGF